MPYRALIWTIVTVGLALLAVGMWIRAVEPMVAGVKARAEPATSAVATTHKTTPEQELTLVVKGTLVLSFVLICSLMMVGLFGTFREWVRYRSGAGRERKGGKTKYVDAWKIAGERLKEKEEGAEGSGSEGPG